MMENSTQSPDVQQVLLVGDPVNKVAVIVYCILGLVILLSGVLGNGFLIVVLVTQGMLRETHNIFIANLTLADLVVVCTGLPFLLLDLLLGYQPVHSLFHCQVNGFILCVAYSVSILSLVAISCNRYMRVCHTTLFNRLFSRNRNVLYCLALWGVGVVLQVPLLAGYPPYGYDAGSHCCQARSVRDVVNYGGLAMSVLLALPVVMIAYFNYAIFHTWSHSRAKFKGVECQGQGEGEGEGEVRSKRSIPTHLRAVFYIAYQDMESQLSSDVAGCTTDTSSINISSRRGSLDSGHQPGEVPAACPPPLPTAASDEALNIQDPVKSGEKLTGDSSSTPADFHSNMAANPSLNQLVFHPDPDKKRKEHPDPESWGKRGKKKVSKTVAAEVALVRSLLVISVTLVALYTPFAVCALADYGAVVPSEVMVLVSLLLFVNCAVNWIIYGAMNTSFRQAYVRTLRHFKCRRSCSRRT